MKIADLKQPYRRMAEYLNDENKTLELSDVFFWFYKCLCEGKNPEITEEIKKYFPPDFDFSGEEKVLILSLNEIAIRLFGKEFNYLETYEKEQVVTSQENKLEFLTKKQNMSLFDKENQRKIEDENLQNRIYTQLAKEGKLEQLPETCEFSEPVELGVWDDDRGEIRTRLILGRFKGKYLGEGFIVWNFAQLPTPKIDFSQFKAGDVVEIKAKVNDTYYGVISSIVNDFIKLSFTKTGKTTIQIFENQIKSITKIK